MGKYQHIKQHWLLVFLYLFPSYCMAQVSEEWVRRYDGNSNTADAAFALVVNDRGNVSVTGRSAVDGFLNTDYATIKYDASGTDLWVRRYNGPFNDADMATAMVLDMDGNVYVTGESTSGINGAGNAFSNIATVKYNTAGEEQWVAIFDGTTHEQTRDRANDIGLDNLGNVYVAGSSGSAEEDPDNDYVTIKYDKNGVQQWVALFAGPGGEQNSSAHALALDAEGNVYITGQCAMEGFEPLDYATIKYNTDGVQQWVISYNGPGNAFDSAEDIGLDAQGNVYVTGRSRYSDFVDAGEDYATIKYVQSSNVTTSIEDQSTPEALASEALARFRTSHAPNPVITTTRIQYELPVESRVSLQVYDALGRRVATLVNTTQNAGVHYIDFDATGLQKGLYYYRIAVHAGEKSWVQTRKLVVAGK